MNQGELCFIGSLNADVFGVKGRIPCTVYHELCAHRHRDTIARKRDIRSRTGDNAIHFRSEHNSPRLSLDNLLCDSSASEAKTAVRKNFNRGICLFRQSIYPSEHLLRFGFVDVIDQDIAFVHSSIPTYARADTPAV